MPNFISTNDARKIVARDIESGAVTSAAADQDVIQVFLVCNVWVAVCEDLGLPIGYRGTLRDLLLAYGLVPVVRGCRSLADELLEGFGNCQLPGECQWEQSHVNDRLQRPLCVMLDYLTSQRNIHAQQDAAKICLQFLLFPERFTYNCAEAAGRRSVEKFLDVNNRNRTLWYDWSLWPSAFVRNLVSSELARIFTEKDWTVDPAFDCGFSNGTVLDVGKTKLPEWYGDAKLPRYALKSPLGKWALLSTYITCIDDDVRYPLPHGSNKFRYLLAPELTLVPKNLDSYRVIFPEDVYMSYYAHGALEGLRRMLKKNGTAQFINEHDQSINREFARIGSTTGEWATIDMSSASDSIPKCYAFTMLPPWFRRVLGPYLSEHFRYVNKGGTISEKKLFTLLTSGNPMTWLFESCWFLAIARAAAVMCGCKKPNHAVFAYGDDLVVRREYYECTCELLECLGHTVNRRKSYGNGLFRESCGGWYYNGTDITPIFWPRRCVSNDVTERYSVLVSLQHRLVDFPCANAWIVEQIRLLYPDVTVSAIGWESDDIWDSSVDEYYSSRVQHCYVVNRYATMPTSFDDLAQHVAYYEYLMWGPSYDSDLDRVLGISTSRYTGLMRYPIDKMRIVKK